MNFFNFKDEAGKVLFQRETSTSSDLSSCFTKGKSFGASCKSFMTELRKKFHKCFNKIRVKAGGRKASGNKFLQSRLNAQVQINQLLKSSQCPVSVNMLKHMLEQIEDEMNNIMRASNYEKVVNYLKSCNPENALFCQTGFWNLKRKLCPRRTDPPMAKRDQKGNLVTAPNALKKLYLDTYVDRLNHRVMKTDLKDIFILKTLLWNSRLCELEAKPSVDWNMRQLDKVLQTLKNRKAIDPNGMLNEVFKGGYIGSDLKSALLMLFNGCKVSQCIPDFMTLSNITSLYKNKGSRLCLENDRGIFIQTTLKKILDKLIYMDHYPSVDKCMSDSNIGARKGKNVRDHLFILYAVINSVVRGDSKCIDIQVYDIQKAFDALWLNDTFNDLFDSLPQNKRDNSISLLYKTNLTNMVAVKTPVGLTKRVNMPEIIQQGGVWGSLLCSNSIDSIGRNCQRSGNYLYKYKNLTEILPLGFVDDLNGIAECGSDSRDLNTYLNAQIELKKLSFHTSTSSVESKCLQMHVGKIDNNCPQLKVHGSNMKKVTEIIYLGDKVCSDGKNTKNVLDRVKKGTGLVSQIFKILQQIGYGTATFEIALLLRESILINGMLTNAEIWHNFTASEMEEFEKVDNLFFQRLFGVPRSCPVAAFFLESGAVPLSIVIQARRLKYLHNILLSPRSSMLSRVFQVQWCFPTKGDWTLLIKKDLEDFGIENNLEKLRCASREMYKKMIKEKSVEYAFKDLSKKKERYKKLENIEYDKLKLQNYLGNNGFSYEEKKLIFQYRTRMANYGQNFRAGRLITYCPLCSSHPDSQFELLNCPIIIEKVRNDKRVDHSKLIIDIYSDEISSNTVKFLKSVQEARSC